ncbi:MAG: hypothetical protein Tp1100MES1331091_31 [Prokaryotic dsDNA virus sp.]|nr:MAG: hypothetical protein Tp1100MES1331091_31 [Prokaryotic dsDNA virus sp.]
MVRETRSTESSEVGQDEPVAVIRGRRVEDELRLRELELQTNFQIKTLTESLNLLKTDFTSWRDSLNEKLSKVDTEVDQLKTRMTILIVLILADLGGAPTILARLLGGV